MKPALQWLWRVCPGLLVFCLLAPPSTRAETLSLKRALELALAQSPAAAQVNADEQRAFASYREAKNNYLPQVVVGSGLGSSWGYPLSLEGSAPSLFNTTAQSALINPALRDFVKSARTEYEATAAGSKDRRNQITQDTVLTYLELMKWQKLMSHLREQQDDASRMEQMVGQRVEEGVDSQQVGKQARLISARARLHMAQAEGAIDVLRERLSQLTGLPAASIDTAVESVSSLPEMQREPDLEAKAAESSP